MLISRAAIPFSTEAQRICPNYIFECRGVKDTELANALSISINEPTLVENCVFTHLIRTFKYISYWRDVEEVDFVINIDNVPIPVEVKYRNKIERKYTKSVVKFCRKFNVNKGIIVTKNEMKKEIIDGIEIWFIPVWLFIAAI